MASRAHQVWRVFVVMILVAAIAVPIYCGVTAGALGVVVGIRWGLILAVVGLVALGVTLAVERVRERRTEDPNLPRATVVTRESR